MDETKNKVDNETAQQAVRILMAESYLQGVQEAKAKYFPTYEKVLKKGEKKGMKKGFALGMLLMIAGYIAYEMLTLMMSTLTM